MSDNRMLSAHRKQGSKQLLETLDAWTVEYYCCCLFWVFGFYCLLVFGFRVSLCSLGCPGTCSVNQAGLELRFPTFVSWMLGSKVYATTTQPSLLSCLQDVYAQAYSAHLTLRGQLRQFSPFTSAWVPRIKLKVPILTSRHLHLLRHATCPCCMCYCRAHLFHIHIFKDHHQNLYRTFLYAPVPAAAQFPSLLTFYDTFAIINDPSLRYHNHPKIIIYSTDHSWYFMVYGFEQIHLE